MARKPRTVQNLKVTPEHHERLKRIGAQKGQPSRNPKGRPPIPEELKQRAADMSLGALERIEWLAENSPNEMVRFRCNEYIISLNVSKAAQEQKIEHNVTHSFGEFLQRANARHASVIEASFDVVTPALTDESDDSE